MLGKTENREKAWKLKLVPLSNHTLKEEWLSTLPKGNYDAMGMCMFLKKDRWKDFEYSSMNILLKVKSFLFQIYMYNYYQKKKTCLLA